MRKEEQMPVIREKDQRFIPTTNSPQATADVETRLMVEGLSAYYGKSKAISNVTLAVKTQKVTAIIGPSGCGKSTFIRCLNRMHEVVPGARVTGKVLLDGEDLYGPGVDPVQVRRTSSARRWEA